MSQNEDANYQKCIETSSICAVACLKAAKSLKKEPQNQQMESLIEMLFACTAACLLNLKSLASESEFLIEVCNNCEEICVKTELECGKYIHLEYCKSTAIACGNCAMDCKVITEM